MKNRKALIIGIDKYKKHKLTACVNDAISMANLLKDNYDGSKNFDVSLLLDKEATRSGIRRGIRQLFKNDDDIALLYFSGHGVDDDNDGFIVSYDFKVDDWGISMPEILKFVNNSKCKNKIVIFDCCYSGSAGQSGVVGDGSVLSDGTIIFTASRKNETSVIRGNDSNSLFTKLFIQALQGAASDMFGNTSPSSIYSFLDQALGTWEQRPIFKSNVETFISLRSNKPRISIKDVKQLPVLFKDSLSFKLDPSFEPTNFPSSKDRHCEPFKSEEHCLTFATLLSFYKNGLIEPVGEKSMYEAAMQSKSCNLTELGKYYRSLVVAGKI